MDHGLWPLGTRTGQTPADLCFESEKRRSTLRLKPLLLIDLTVADEFRLPADAEECVRVLTPDASLRSASGVMGVRLPAEAWLWALMLYGLVRGCSPLGISKPKSTPHQGLRPSNRLDARLQPLRRAPFFCQNIPKSGLRGSAWSAPKMAKGHGPRAQIYFRSIVHQPPFSHKPPNVLINNKPADKSAGLSWKSGS